MSFDRPFLNAGNDYQELQKKRDMRYLVAAVSTRKDMGGHRDG